MTDTDVVVVGGGATGVGVARDLAIREVDVTVCERGGLGAGTTGRSHGLLHSGARYATADPEGAAHCIRENRVLREIGGAAVRETGGLFVQLPGDDPDHFAARTEACRDLDIPAAELSAKRARDAEPELAPDVERAFRVPDGVVSPARLVAATAESARRHGADVCTRAPVEEIRREGDRVVGVETDTGRISANHVVNAGGAWAGRVAALAGLDVPMAPTKGAMVAVDVAGVASVVNRCRPPGDGDIAVPHEDRVVLGTTSAAVADPDDYPREAAAVNRILEEGAAMLPAVADADVEDVYWGVRPLYDAGAGGREASRTFQVFDHADDGRPGMTTVTGGKLTTHRLMAEAVADSVCERLGVDEPCRTAAEPLPAEASTIGELVERFDARGPADADVVR
jgi:glycerol-3-phosphate dehydrogenase